MAKKSKKLTNQRKVDDLQARYDDLGQLIECLKEENIEVFAELSALLSEQNAILDELTMACRQLELGTSMVTVTPTFRREFDGRKLHRALAAVPEVRKRVIKIIYKVDAKEFDRAVQHKEIDESAQAIAVKELTRSITVRSAAKAVPIP